MPELEARQNPGNLEAERGVLGSLLLSGGDAGEVFSRLRAEHFFARPHQLLYSRICRLYDQHGHIDAIVLYDLLEREGIAEEVGGRQYLLQLTETVETSANAERYAEIVLDRALLRSLIGVCSDVIQEVHESSEPAETLLDRAEQRIFEIAERRSTEPMVRLRDALKMTFDLFDQWAEGNTGLTTGYVDLDGMIGGLQPGELIVIAGRPSMGKTTLALNIAQNVAVAGKTPVAIFSLEVNSRQLAMNVLCGAARVNASELRRNTSLNRGDWKRLTAAADVLSEAELFIDDSPRLNPMAIRAKARRLVAKKGVQLVIVDYLQMLEVGGIRPENRQQEISAISRTLKALARELQVPIIAVSQLSRAVESREAHRPRLSDLRESGAIEQDADLVLLLYREEYYKPEREDAKGKAEVIIAKQRNGPVGSVELAFIGEHLRFENLAHFQEEF